MQYKYGLVYREIIRTPLVDVCQLNKVGATNALTGMVLQIFKASAPEIIHDCPYDVSIFQNSVF